MTLTQSKNFWKLEQTWTEYKISYVVLKMFVFCKVCIVRTLRTFLYIRISKQSRPTDVILISYTRYFTSDNMFNNTHLSIYKIWPPGSIRTSTFGTVTYWNSASFALGKYTSGFQIALTKLGSFRSRGSTRSSCSRRVSDQCCRRYKSTW